MQGLLSASLDKFFVIIGIHGTIVNGLVMGGLVQDEPARGREIAGDQ
jgi:hypothetical protein